MTSYFTRSKASSEVELEDTQPGDSASVAATTPASISSVGLQVGSTRELESVSTEVAGSMTTHPQLSPEGDHPPVGGHGVTGSADSLQWGLPWDTPVDVQTHLIAMELELPMFSSQPILQRYRQQAVASRLFRGSRPLSLTRRLPPFKVLHIYHETA